MAANRMEIKRLSVTIEPGTNIRVLGEEPTAVVMINQPLGSGSGQRSTIIEPGNPASVRSVNIELLTVAVNVFAQQNEGVIPPALARALATAAQSKPHQPSYPPATVVFQGKTG